MFCEIVLIDRLQLHQRQQREKAKVDLIQKADEVHEDLIQKANEVHAALKDFVKKVL